MRTGVILSIIVLLLIGAAEPPEDSKRHAEDNTKGELVKAAERIRTAIADLKVPIDESRSCKPGVDERNSELCAQWKAADAARETANYTFFAVLTSLASALFVGFTFLRQQKTTRTELRPYLNPIELSFDHIVQKGNQFLAINMVWKNAGKTPAKDVELEIRYTLRKSRIKRNIDLKFLKGYPRPFALAPNQTARTVAILIPFPDIPDIFHDRKFAYIYSLAQYGSMFNRKDNFETKVLWRIGFLGDANKPLDGNNIQQVQWWIEPYFNSVT